MHFLSFYFIATEGNTLFVRAVFEFILEMRFGIIHLWISCPSLLSVPLTPPGVSIENQQICCRDLLVELKQKLNCKKETRLTSLSSLMTVSLWRLQSLWSVCRLCFSLRRLSSGFVCWFWIRKVEAALSIFILAMALWCSARTCLSFCLYTWTAAIKYGDKMWNSCTHKTWNCMNRNSWSYLLYETRHYNSITV